MSLENKRDCGFCLHSVVEYGKPYESMLTCRRNAPGSSENGDPIWPAVSPDHVCGEFERDETVTKD